MASTDFSVVPPGLGSLFCRLTPDLRPGLHSVAALRLGWGGVGVRFGGLSESQRHWTMATALHGLFSQARRLGGANEARRQHRSPPLQRTQGWATPCGGSASEVISSGPASLYTGHMEVGILRLRVPDRCALRHASLRMTKTQSRITQSKSPPCRKMRNKGGAAVLTTECFLSR
jgi:hypothetical protein